MLLLQKYNLAKNAYKWIGLVSTKVARKMFAEGDFITEDSKGLTVFHGKLSHMLQYAIILYLMEQGEIHLDYEIEGKSAQIQISDILQAFADDLDLRATVFDIRYPETISFSDPFRLYSQILEKSADWGCQYLADYLINSFCKGIRKRLDACKEVYNLSTMDMVLFSEQANDFSVELFTDTPQSLDYAKKCVLNKNAVSQANPALFFAKGDTYAVVCKNFNPNQEFTPRKFSH